MITAAFKDYLPFGDLVKILVVCLVAAVVAPSAVSIAIVGLDRREKAAAAHESSATGTALIAVGMLILAVLIGLGLYALFTD